MAQQVAEYSPSPLVTDTTAQAQVAPIVPPTGYATTRRTFHVPFTLQPQKGSPAETLTLPVVVTLPDIPTTVWPAVVLFNGFQCRAHYYQHIADYIASRGFAVLQYTTPLLRIIPDKDELPFLGQLLGWVAAAQRDGIAQRDDADFSRRAVDLSKVCVAGHSRGAKLAALHYAANADIAAAALIDPVNNTKYTAESPEYPDACKALQAAGRPVGIIGAGVIGSGNPEGSNWRTFYAASPPGSWLSVFEQAAHGQFCKAGCITQGLIDLVFGAGKLSRQQVLDLAGPAIVSWFQHRLECRAAGGSPPAAPGRVAAAHAQKLEGMFQQGVAFSFKQ